MNSVVGTKENPMGRIGVGEVIVVILFVIIFFGAKKIPEIASSIAKAIKEFKKAAAEPEDENEKKPQ